MTFSVKTIMKAAPRFVNPITIIDNKFDEVKDVNLDVNHEFTILPERIQCAVERLYSYINLMSILLSIILIGIYLLGVYKRIQ